MTIEHFQAPDAPGFRLDPRVVAAFGRFAGGFWRGAFAANVVLMGAGFVLIGYQLTGYALEVAQSS